jgi:hypothetical protein
MTGARLIQMTVIQRESDMAIDPIIVGDDYKWGLLVKSWATGQDYVGGDLTKPYPYPRPQTLQEFNDQTAKAGAGVVIPRHITSLLMIQGTKEVLLIKLPPKEMVKDSENTLQTQPYTVPPFYSPRAFGNTPAVVTDKMAFHAERIGDYTIRICM